MANNIFKELERGNLTGLKRCISLFPSSVSARNSAGATPLHVAAAQGLPAFVKELLVHGAQHDATDSHGNLPLHLAAGQGSLESVTELLTGPGRKLVVKAKNKEGQAPLHLAVRNGHTSVVAKLLDAGARTDAKDKAGITPLELVSPDDEDMLQLLLNGTPTNAHVNASQSISTPPNARSAEGAHVPHRSPVSGSHVPSSALVSSGRLATPPPVTVGAGAGGRGANATPSTPPGRNAGHGMPPAARASIIGTPGALTNRMPRSIGVPSASPNVAAGHGPGGGAGAGAGGGATPGGTSAVNAQLQKHDGAIQTLKAGLRAATERLGAIDACASAQLECASQVEKALEACGSHGRAITDLDARVGFQEERGRDTRSRLERLEEGERSLQDTVLRLTEDQRDLGVQFQKLSDQVAAGSADASQRRRSADEASAASHPSLQQHQQLHSDVAALRAQVEQLFPALAVATAASAEARALAARLDTLQQQMQQQQHANQHQQQPQQQQQQTGSSLLLEQQVLQLQAQVQLLQLPVASLTQQCADLSSRLGGLTEWQQQARAELAKLAESAASQAVQADGNRMGGELSEAVMRVLDTTARTMTELRQQQDETAKQVAALLQQQQQQQQQTQAGAPASPAAPTQPAVPVTPKSISQRLGHGGDAGAASGPPSRNVPSLGSMARDAAAQAEMRTELEALKSLVADVRKEVASEGGSLRREWQRAFSDMQSRYGEQTNELRAREQNIAKLREAMLVEEAERRAAAGFEEKVAARLSKLETGIEYLTHRLEVLEEQVSGLATTATGANSPMVPLSPARLPSAGTQPTRMQPSPADPRTAPRSGPGPVSENHSVFSPSGSARLAAAAAVAVASTRPLGHDGGWAAGDDINLSVAAAAAAARTGVVGLCGGGSLLCAPDAKEGLLASLPPSSRTDGAAASSARQPCNGSAEVGEALRGSAQEEWWQEASAQSSQRSRGLGPGPSPAASGREYAALPAPRSSVGATPRFHQAPPLPASARGSGDQGPSAVAGLLKGGLVSQPTLGAHLAGGGDGLASAAASQDAAQLSLHQQQLQQRQWHPDAGRGGVLPLPGGSRLEPPPRFESAGCIGLQDPTSTLHGGQPGSGRPQGTVAGAGALVDPANVALGPQLLPAAAQAMLAPSVDIQRLAAAAQHLHLPWQHQLQQQQQQAAAQQPQQQQPSQAAGASVSLQAMQGALPDGDDGGGGSRALGGAGVVTATAATTSIAGAGHGPAARAPRSPRREPPMCFFCPVQ